MSDRFLVKVLGDGTITEHFRVYATAGVGVVETNTIVAAAIDEHNDVTTNVHGIADTDDLETVTGAANQIATHAADTTAVHGIPDTSLLETQAGAAGKVAAHEADTTAVHGIANTALLETTAGAQAKVDTLEASVTTAFEAGDTTVAGDAATALAAHAADTTAIHGIANTALLETTAGAQAKVDTLEASVTTAFEAGDTTVAAAAASALSAHEADTTAVHGIANTALLETTAGAQAKVDTHAIDTTAVHGIADTSALATDAELAAAVANIATEIAAAVEAHRADTTGVHGISDTSVLETVTGSQDKVDDLDAELPTRYALISTPEAFGTVGGGGDDTTEIQAAIDAGPRTVLLGGGKTFRASALTIPSNRHLIIEKGATLLCTGGGQFILIADSDDVTIDCYGLIDGDKASNAGGGSHLISIRGNASRVRIPRAHLVRAKGATAAGGAWGDGIYIGRGDGTSGTLNAIPSDITIGSGVVCDSNTRQGMSVTAVQGLTVEDGATFRNTSGDDPGAGIDLEPDSATLDVIEDVTIGAIFSYSNEYGVMINNAVQAGLRNIKIHGAICRDNRTNGLYLNCAGVIRGLTVSDGVITDNGVDGIVLIAAINGVRIHDNEIRGNDGNGITTTGGRFANIHDNTIALNGLHGISIGYVFSGKLGHQIHDNTIMNNGAASAGTYHGITVPGNASHDDHTMLIAHNIMGNHTNFGTATQQNNINLGASAQYVRLASNIHIGQLGSDVNSSPGIPGIFRLDILAQGLVSGGVGLSTRTKAGVPSNSDFNSPAPPDGTMIADSTNSRLYVKVGGTWKYTALT